MDRYESRDDEMTARPHPDIRSLRHPLYVDGALATCVTARDDVTGWPPYCTCKAYLIEPQREEEHSADPTELTNPASDDWRSP